MVRLQNSSGEYIMKVQVVDISLFQESNGCYFSRNIGDDYIFDVYAIVNIKKSKYVLLYLHEIQVLNFFKLNESIQITDNIVNSKWIITKKFKSKLRIRHGFGSYLQDILYKEVYCPKWMIEDENFFLELIENPNQAKTKFFKHEGTNMIK